MAKHREPELPKRIRAGWLVEVGPYPGYEDEGSRLYEFKTVTEASHFALNIREGTRRTVEVTSPWGDRVVV